MEKFFICHSLHNVNKILIFSHAWKSHFSGQTLYDPVLDTLYNILFTAYPIGWFATFDRESNYDHMECNSKLYKKGMSNEYFNLFIFWLWFFLANSAGLIIYLFNCFVFPYALQGENSDIVDQWSIGSSMFTCIVFVVNLRILLATNTHTIFSFLVFLFSISSYILVLLLTNKIPTMQTFSQFDMMTGNKVFILSNVLIITTCILIQYGYNSLALLIENYIKKLKKQASNKKKIKSSIKKVEFEDAIIVDKGYSVSLDKSINEQLIIKDLNMVKRINNEVIENKINSFNKNGDEEVVSNLRRRCKIYILNI
jgi:magnesium-transporting ATPase (P-type)